MDLYPDQNAAAFQLYLFNIVGLKAAHLHLGAPGTNGPVVAFLFLAPTNPIPGSIYPPGLVSQVRLLSLIEAVIVAHKSAV